VDAGKVKKEDARDFMHDLMEKGETQRKEIQKMIKDEVSSTVGDLGSSGISKEELRAMIREELAAAQKD
jgi:polyhydroxyalkanoate synthesis regulator phasin